MGWTPSTQFPQQIGWTPSTPSTIDYNSNPQWNSKLKLFEIGILKFEIDYNSNPQLKFKLKLFPIWDRNYKVWNRLKF